MFSNKLMKYLGEACRLFVFVFFLLMPPMISNAESGYNRDVGNSASAEQVFLKAKAFHDGEGVPQDLKLACALYNDAANLGSVYAKVNLGYMLFLGEGCEQDYKASRQWYSEAASEGNAAAISTLIMMDRLQLGLKNIDFTDASTLLAKAERDPRENFKTSGSEVDSGTIQPGSEEAHIERSYNVLINSDTLVASVIKTSTLFGESNISDGKNFKTLIDKRPSVGLAAELYFLLAAGFLLCLVLVGVIIHFNHHKSLEAQTREAYNHLLKLDMI